MQTHETQMYRVRAVAQRLDVHVSTVYRLVHSGQLHAARVGVRKGALRIPADSLDAYMHSIGMELAAETTKEVS